MKTKKYADYDPNILLQFVVPSHSTGNGTATCFRRIKGHHGRKAGSGLYLRNGFGSDLPFLKVLAPTFLNKSSQHFKKIVSPLRRGKKKYAV
jgi:hypothetical protein